MITIFVLPVLKCMHFLHNIAAFIMTVSFYVGRTIILVLIEACNIVRDVLITLAIIGEELYRFVCELNITIAAVSSYVRSSANCGINCILEAVGVFVKHIATFFVNTRLHSKLLATHIGSFIGDFLHLFRNALLLIADCAWWLITLLPRWLLYAIITVGDFLVDSITSIRKVLVYTAQVIVEDIFRLTIGIVVLFLFWHNRRRLGFSILRWALKLKRLIKSCCLGLLIFSRRIFRRRIEQTLTIPLRTSGIQRRSPLTRQSTSSNRDKALDSTQRCVICKDRQKCVLLLPCKHLCLCEECADYMFFSARRQNCPLCRTFIDHSMSVYM